MNTFQRSSIDLSAYQSCSRFASEAAANLTTFSVTEPVSIVFQQNNHRYLYPILVKSALALSSTTLAKCLSIWPSRMFARSVMSKQLAPLPVHHSRRRLPTNDVQAACQSSSDTSIDSHLLIDCLTSLPDPGKSMKIAVHLNA